MKLLSTPIFPLIPGMLVCAMLLSGLYVPAVSAADISVQSDTLLHVFERDTVNSSDKKVIPGYEYLRVDVGDLETKGLSLHFYGWGRVDLADNGFFEEKFPGKDETAGELLYGYFEYTRPASNILLRVGRQHIFEGGANESVDGVRLGSDLGRYFSISVYGGQPVGLDNTNGRSGDSIGGGRVSYHKGTYADVGISYKTIRNNSEVAEEIAAIDLSLFFPYGINFYGYSALNLETDGWAEHSYAVQFGYNDFSFRPFVEMYKYENYFAAGANGINPFPILAATGEELTVFGGDSTWRYSDAWDFGANLKFYEYDERESSSFYSLLVDWHDEEADRVGGELGYMLGDAANNDYLLARLFAYRALEPDSYIIDFITGDIVYASYDKKFFGEDASLFVSLGAGFLFFNDTFQVKLSGDYSSDPFFDDDFRGLFTLTYIFNRNNQ